MAEPIGPMLKIKDKAAALEIERILQFIQQKIGPNNLDIRAVGQAIQKFLQNGMEVPFFRDFKTGIGDVEIYRLEIKLINPTINDEALYIQRGNTAVSSQPAVYLISDDDSASTSTLQVEQIGAGRAITAIGPSVCDNITCDDNTVNGKLSPAGVVLQLSYETIASDTITIDGSQCFIQVDSEGGAASDDLDTISGGANGQILFLMGNGSPHTINVTNTDNIDLASSPRVLSNQHDYLMLFYFATLWHELLYSNV